MTTTTPTTAAVSARGIRHLRALGHGLDPVVQIGKDGITPALVAAAKQALVTHELIKVRIGTEVPIDRKAAAAELAAACDATLAQILGRTALLYRRNPKNPKIKLPAATVPRPRKPSSDEP